MATQKPVEKQEAEAGTSAARRPPRWMFIFHRRPADAGGKVRGPDAYDGSFAFFPALAPAIWLAIVGGCLLVALGVVGYLSFDPELVDSAGNATGSPFARFVDALPKEADYAKRRAAWAFSGVTLAITMALAIASAFWAVKAFLGKANVYRLVVLLWVAVFFLLSVGILLWMHFEGYQPFASTVANELLKKAYPRPTLLVGVPEVMFALACALPAILSAGACFLLQPIPQSEDPVEARSRLGLLIGRLRELDQLLYVGALTLVFGTLQLSAGMSVPLASMPSPAELKVQADLCKSVSPASPASSLFTTPAASAPKLSYYEGFGVGECRKLPREFARVAAADDLRQLARGVTLSFGLAFSALLAAIYVPALIGMSLMIDPLQKVARASATDGREEKKEERIDIGEVDPLRRVAATVATLSPLIASLLANAYATG